MDKIPDFLKKHKILLLFLLIFILISAGFFSFLNEIINPQTKITAQFSDLGPLYKKMPVYYKGYKIGTTKKIEPSKDYKSTLVTILLYPKDLKLPENVTAKVKKLDTGIDYIALEYPKKPSDKNLKTGSVIHGETAMDIQSFMSAQADSGVLGAITENMSQTLTSISQTSQDIGDFFYALTEVVDENRPIIKQTTTSLASSAENINQMTIKINNSLSSEKLNNSTNNIEETTKNIKDITENLNETSKNLNTTIQHIDSTVCELNAASANIKSITAGVCKLMTKRFAGVRIIFGKPMPEDNCPCQKGCRSK